MVGYRNDRTALIVTMIITVVALSILYALFVQVPQPPYPTLTTTTPTTPIEDVIAVKEFKSYDELKNFLEDLMNKSRLITGWDTGYYMMWGRVLDTFEIFMAESATGAFPPAVTQAITYGVPAEIPEEEPWYSTTNIQVEGVDEIDFFKSDGEYFYVVGSESWSNGTFLSYVYIVKVYPPTNMSIVAKLTFVNTSVVGLYIIPDANKLVIINQSMPMYWIRPLIASPEASEDIIALPPRYFIPNISVLVYDVNNKASPELVSKSTFSGSFRASRLIGTNVYVITIEPIIAFGPSSSNRTTLVPLLNGKPLPPEAIKYLETADITFLSNYVSIYVRDVTSGEENMESYMMPYPEWVYVSINNIYVVSSDWRFMEMYTLDILNNTILPLLPPNVKQNITAIMSDTNLSIWEKEVAIMDTLGDYFWSLTPEERRSLIDKIQVALSAEFVGTSITWSKIYKISMSGLDTALTATGTVPGRVTDQFSMDEYKGYFRVATTSDIIRSFKVEKVVWSEGEVVIDEGTAVRPPPIVIWPEIEQTNNVYVLDEDLKIIGRLENIEPGERIYATRYMGTYMFLVTFRRVDPLFAIDLSDPENPTIIGYVKIPGYSEYLHPYGDHYLIGVGFEADEAGRIKGLKVSLFDVSDLKNVEEVSKVTITDRWAYTPVLGDHKAFLLNPIKGYLTVPVTVYGEGGSKNRLYVIDIGKNGNLTLRGEIAVGSAYRAAYIYDVIYAVGPETVTAIDYGNMSVINSLELP